MRIHSICAPGGDLPTNSPTQLRALGVGLAAQYAAKLQSHWGTTLPNFIRLAEMAHNMGQLKVYINGFGDCVGYAIWAFLGPEVEQEFIAGKVRLLKEFEFNEGTSAWILDMAVAPGSLPYVLMDLRDVVFRDYQEVTYFRDRGRLRFCRRISRESNCSFLRVAANPDMDAA